MFKKSLFLAILGFLFTAVAALGQDATIKPTYVKGEVVAVEAGKIVVKSDAGQWTGALNDKTSYKRVSPDNPTDLKGAADASASDMNSGDKVLLSALANKDGNGFYVRTVYLMTRSDLSARTQKENERWRNGIFGKVTAINPAANQLTVEVGTNPLEKTVLTLTPKADAKFMRYAPTSVKFADAKPSAIGEITVGDRLRAIGEKSADGKSFTATEVLSGGFRQATGKIQSIDATNKQVVVKDLTTNKSITIDFAGALFLKKFPADMAARMAGTQAGGMAGGGMRPPGGTQSPAGGQVVVMGPPAGGGPPNGGQAGAQGQGGGFRAGGGNLDVLVDRMPNITAADLKPGDTIAVLTSGPLVGTQTVKALKLLAGVEPFVEIAQRQAAVAGARGAANSPNFNIPGLDGGMGLP